MRRQLVTAQGVAISIRPASQRDEPFLHALHADRRAEELAPLGWSAAERLALLDMQFRAQQVGYGNAFPHADNWLVGVGSATAGRLLVDRRTDEHRVVDVVISTGYRGLGIGTVLMEEVMNDAGRMGLPVRLTVVAHDHRLAGWYQRLGFVVTGQQSPHLAMVWSPDPTRAE